MDLTRSVAAILLVAVLLVPLGGEVGASGQPVPICDVCGATFHPGVTETTATSG